MKNSSFNPNQQQKELSSKIVTGLERISEVFKVLLWEQAKFIGLSPIQIQILIFIAYHKEELCIVSHLAKEFNITKPTVSDAVKILDKKKLIIKDYASSDNRSYSIRLSLLGKKVVEQTSNFANPLKTQIESFNQTELNGIYKTLSELIYKLNQVGILSVQRSCYACKFHQKNGTKDFCKLLDRVLQNQDIRIDCPEFEELK